MTLSFIRLKILPWFAGNIFYAKPGVVFQGNNLNEVTPCQYAWLFRQEVFVEKTYAGCG